MPKDANAAFMQWLADNNAAPVVLIVSPSGAQVPLRDALPEAFKGWRVVVGVVERGSNDNDS